MNLFSNLVYRLTAPLRLLTAPFRMVLGWPIRLVVNPGRLLGLSLPTRVALFLALFLVLLVATAVVAVLLFPEAAEWQQFARPSVIALIVVLLVSIPLIARQTVRLFIEGNVASHPRIDEAWREGLAALKVNNLDLTRLPLFLVLGAGDRAQMDAIMDSAGMKLLVRAVPEGRQPLRWYAGERGIVLACADVGCLTLVNSPQPRSQSAQHTLRPQGVGETLVTGTLPAAGAGDLAAAEDSPFASTPEFSPSVWGTLVAVRKKTLLPGSERDKLAGATEAGLTRGQVEEQTQRLQHVCQLLRRARQPYCPLNGILTLISWQAVQNALLASREIPEAVQHDLSTIETTAELSAPITALVTGMESEKGFLELVRRVGREKSRARFGKGFELTNAPTPSNMETLASQACGAFEDWVYRLFRDPDGLNKPGNIQLYGLLCKTRSRLTVRLKKLLANGFALEAADGRRMLAGLYFAATGNSPDTRCFVEGVMDKMLRSEEELQWTDRIVREDRRFLTVADIGMFVNTLLVVALLGLLVYEFIL